MKATRLLTLALVASLALGGLAACGAKPTQEGAATAAPENTASAASGTATQAAPAPAAQEGLDKDGVTNREGYPIAKEPVTITAALKYSAMRPDMGNSNIWDYVAQRTNINIEFEMYKENDQIDLMFASRDFPDMLMQVGIKANQITSAVEGGDFVEMEPLIKEHAPTWYAFMQENKMVYNASLATDGKMYSLPYIDFAPYDRNIRDQWIIMGNWLDELGLEVPTTTDEFANVLTQFKENAGKGSIPEDVIPLFIHFDGYVGGQFDIYASFGVYVTDSDYMVVNDGVVSNQAINPAIKEPLKYLRDLYAKGLMPPEIFTDDWNTYISKISSDPPIAGSYFSYANRQPSIGVPMGPIDSGNGQVPLMRSQAYVPGPAHVAIITSNNPYPVATTRFFEMLATDTEMMVTINRGTKGVLWDYDEAGKAYQLFWEESPDKMAAQSMDVGMNNSFLALKDAKFYAALWNEVTYNEPGSRAWAYESVYKDASIPTEMLYTSGTLATDDINMLNQYKTDLANYRKAMFADFITGAQDIDAQWDTFTAQMEKLGLADFVALKQKGYDLMVK